MTEEFKSLLENAGRILITSHISPDPDAVSSLLLLGTALRLNYPDKQIRMVLEEEPVNLDFLAGYSEIEFKPVAGEVVGWQPELFVLLDGNNYERCSRHDGQKIRDYITANGVKTAVIDHHELTAKDQTDVFINNNSPATAQDVYQLCFNQLNLEKPEGAVQTAMTGLYADSGGFAYTKDGSEERMFDFAKELVAQGARVEEAKNQLSRYNDDDIKTLNELFANLSHKDDYSFSFLSDKFINEWEQSGHSQAALQPATGTFLNEYIRNIDGRQWGFIVYRNVLQGDDMYAVSLRAVNGVKDVSKIANSLGGGGHKPAAGAKFSADSCQDALAKVQAAIVAP